MESHRVAGRHVVAHLACARVTLILMYLLHVLG
jgi:hypothetical protein